MKIDRDNRDIIWINPAAPDEGKGFFEKPFSSIEAGLERVKPGQTIVLQGGEYILDLNIQVSGTALSPIYIVAEPGAEVIIKAACWFFYDTSDLIVEGMTFADAPYGAISLIGACSRNRFDAIRFVNCGARRHTACTLYIGGAGGGCNVVEDCSFEHAAPALHGKVTADNASIGIMISQGDATGGSPIVDTLVRRNRFVNYGYGIIIGGDDSPTERCGHIVEYNTVRNSSNEGILVKCGDTLVRGNVVENCSGNALSVQSELDCSVEGNRIVDCRRGIRVHGRGHSVSGNCLIRCAEGAIRVCGASESEGAAASNCFIEKNTFVNCSCPSGGDDRPIAGVIIDPGTTGIMQHNLVYGAGKPYAVVEPPRGPDTGSGQMCKAPVTRFVIKDNGAAGGCLPLDGVGTLAVVFADAAADDYGNECGAGASGWVLKPQGFDPAIDELPGDIDYREASILEDEAGEPVVPGSDEGGRGNLFGNFFAEALEEETGDADAAEEHFEGNEA